VAKEEKQWKERNRVTQFKAGVLYVTLQLMGRLIEVEYGRPKVGNAAVVKGAREYRNIVARPRMEITTLKESQKKRKIGEPWGVGSCGGYERLRWGWMVDSIKVVDGS